MIQLNPDDALSPGFSCCAATGVVAAFFLRVVGYVNAGSTEHGSGNLGRRSHAFERPARKPRMRYFVHAFRAFRAALRYWGKFGTTGPYLSDCQDVPLPKIHT